MKKKSFNDRRNDEKKEGYDTVKTDLPSERFQEEKQVVKPDDLGVTKSSIPGTDEAVTTSNVTPVSAAKNVRSKIKVAPDVSVDELKNTQVGGVPLANPTSFRSVAGLSSQSNADDVSKTPYSKGNYRSDTRYGKKRSEELFEMDNTILEQVVPIVDDSKDLRESPDSVQGYNGRKQFKQTRSKKNFGFINGNNHNLGKIPQQLLNDCSVDFVETSKMVYTGGQVISSNIDAKAGYPTQIYGGIPVKFIMNKGNYKPTALVLTISGDNITSIHIDEDYFEVSADPVTRDQSNMNWQVDMNNVAKSMVKLQTTLGRETTDKWSPLGYVVNQPYEYNMLLHDIDNSTGAIMATAYRSAVSSLAFQKNILAKDGVNPQLNAVKMIYEGFYGQLPDDSTGVIVNSDFDSVIFNQDMYDLGSAAAIINMFDSTKKYKTKADLLGMQRSFGLHLSQCDNNINPLHCKPNFIKALDRAHMFSTVDGNYNPMLPIFTTKKIKLVNNLSLEAFLVGWKNPHIISDWTDADRTDPLRDQDTGTLSNYAYKYSDLRNSYITRVQHPIIEGLIRWLLKHEGAIVSTFGNNTVTIPFEFNMQNPSLLSFMLCSAAQDVLWERNICFRDILFAGEQESYVWDDLVGLDKLNPLYSSQMTIGAYTDPLKLGKLSSDTVIRELWNGQMQLSDYDSGVAQYFAPWYMNEHAFNSNIAGGSYTVNEGFSNEPTAFNMSIPSIRDGVRHEYVDVIKAMDERDVRLALDRWTTIPVFDDSVIETAVEPYESTTLWTKHTSVTNSTILNNNIKLSACRYDGNSDGRLIIKYDLVNGSNRKFTPYALNLVPKELGWIDDDYDNEYIITSINSTQPTRTLLDRKIQISNTGVEAYNGASPMDIVSYRVYGDSYTDIGIDRSAALTAVFYRYFADSDANTYNTYFVNNTGVIPCYSYNDGKAVDLYGVYNLESKNESTYALDTVIRSNASRIWTMLQRFFLPINRFENSTTLDTSTHSYDPLENAFYFGLCGFLASDYTQDILERLDIYDQLGLDYTEDVFVKDSLIFR